MRTMSDRFWSKVDQRGPDECWPWLSPLNPDGYGQFWVTEMGRSVRAHHVAYRLTVGEVVDTLDHTCHTNDLTCPGGPSCPHRACMNPAHLEPVSRGENSRRGKKRITHCPQGHPYTPENTQVYPLTGWRRCRQCHREKEAARRQWSA